MPIQSQKEHLKIHYLQHVPYEGLGCIQHWIQEKGHAVSATRFYEDIHLPYIHSFDWLIIMGGPMSVGDEMQYPWLRQEKQFIKQAIDEGKTVLGICLGAQLIAAALGARVYPNPQKEIGWFPVQKVAQADQSELLSFLPDALTAFHWHGDTFDLPVGAIHLAQTPACKHQAFQYGKNVLGLQFHLEVTHHALLDMVAYGKHEFVKADYIQSPEEITHNTHFIAQTNRQMWHLLDKLQVQSSSLSETH